MKPISLISPSRNNLRYLKWSYNSVRKHLGYFHEYCVAVDYSNDGTEEWCKEIADNDINFKYIVNDGTWFGENVGEPSRMGHCLLYDKLINEVATNNIVMIWHADMAATPGIDEEIDKYIEPGIVVSLTRIEPPLHPRGPEKIIWDFGIEPEEFNEQELLEYVSNHEVTEPGITEGIFAPWAIYKSDFQAIGGHDPIFAPQSKEDSDIFNRFQLNGYKFIQTWNGFVYHMTCRGSRFKDGAKRNPDGQVFMKDRETNEWLIQNLKSTREFIRKWGSMVNHDEYLKPIVDPKYDIAFIVSNCSLGDFNNLEPWCGKLYYGLESDGHAKLYIKEEQQKTSFDLSKRVISHTKEMYNHNITVKFDCKELSVMGFKMIPQLSKIIADTNEMGEFEYDIFKITINDLTTYEHENIKVTK